MLAIRGYFALTHKEAEEKEVTQIGKSACGATAVLNVLVSLTIDIAHHVHNSDIFFHYH